MTNNEQPASGAVPVLREALAKAEIGLANAKSYEGRALPANEAASVASALNVVRAALSSTAGAAVMEAGSEAKDAARYRGPAKFTPEEVARGNVGIRWVTAEGVAGRPTQHDVLDYLAVRGDDAACSCNRCKSVMDAAAAVPAAGGGEAEGWVQKGRVQFWRKPAAPPAGVQGDGWKTVTRDGMPPCDGETVFVGINSAGFACCFNDARPDGLCLMGSPECSTAQMSELHWWRVLDRPAGSAAADPIGGA